MHWVDLNTVKRKLETVLVTGGSGFIGSHICMSLIANNYNVLVIDSYK